MNCRKDISIFCTIGRTMRSITLLLEEEFQKGKVDLNLSQFIILNLLSVNENVILEDLSRMIKKDKSAVLRNVNHLEKNHFVAKMTDSNDKRRKVLMATQKGIEILKKARLIEKKLQESLTENVSQEDINSFEKVLSMMLEKSFKANK